MNTAETLTFKPTDIETIICVHFQEAKRWPMTNELSEMMIRLFLGGNKTISEDEKPFLYKVIESRIKVCFSYTCDSNVIIFLCVLSKTPGTAMLYLWYLQYYCHKRKVVKITFSLFCEIFPVGFPSDTDLQKIWDAQKVKQQPDNLVDYIEAGKSLF